MLDLVVQEAPGLPVELTQALDSAAGFARSSKAQATLRAYRSDYADFCAWCERMHVSALPAAPETVAAYLASLADRGFKASTVARRAAAIGFVHRKRELEPPTNSELVRATLRGIRRHLGVTPDQKAALTDDLVAKMLRRIPTDTLTGQRDRALLLIGFAGALRRSELVALEVEDLQPHRKGMLLQIRKSKSDQEASGRVVAILSGSKLRPVAALDAWLEAAAIEAGPVFRAVRGDRVSTERLCDRQVARIVKARAAAAKLDPELFGAHSLRSGFVTTAVEKGAELATIAEHCRHAKLDTTMEYFRAEDAFRNHAGKRFL
jgi:site-specific recombinase XerD